MIVRLARREDADSLMRLYGHLSRGYRDNRAAIEAAIVHPTTFLYVAEVSGCLAGTAAFSVPADPCRGFIGYVDDVVVDPAFRGRGVAEKQLSKLIELAKQLNCVRIDLTASVSRTTAIRLYERLGFKRYETNVFRLSI
jgi:ribosomal protein S18 acetylase RimI-like enzyme